MSEKKSSPTTTDSPATGECPYCGVTWTVVNRHWLWKETSGALHSRRLLNSEIGANDEPKPLTECPQCRCPLDKAGRKAKKKRAPETKTTDS